MSNNITSNEITSYIDVDSGLARVCGNKALFKRMLDLFVKCEEKAAFEKSLADGDLNHASEVMHSIKGMSGNLSLTRVYELSSEITNQLRKGEVDDEMIAEYRIALEKTLQCVDEIAASLV